MLRLRTLGLALVAVFAVSAVAAVSSASAQVTLPAVVRCAKVEVAMTGRFSENKCETLGGTKEWIRVYIVGKSLGGTEECAEVVEAGIGTFENSGCTTAGTGTKNFIKVVEGKPKFTSSSGEGELETASGEIVKCKSDTNVGEFTGPRTDKVTITFKGCTGPEGTTCTTGKEAAGTIVTNKLVSKLVYLKEVTAKEREEKIKPIVGLELSPEAGVESKDLFAEFVCSVSIIKVTVKVGVHETGKGGMDSSLGEIESAFVNNKLHKEASVIYKCTAKGKQQWKSYLEGGVAFTDFLETETSLTGKWEESCIRETGGDKITFEEEGEIKA